MAEHGRITHPELIESFDEESRLSRCGPDPEPWPLTMAKAWPIEAHDTIGLSKKINKPADREILDHGSVAMEQHDARSVGITPFNIVETYAVALDELADRRVPAFRQSGENNVPNYKKDQQQSQDEQDGFSGGHDYASITQARYTHEPAC